MSNSTAAANVEFETAGLNTRAKLIATLTSPLVALNEAELGAFSFMRIMLKLEVCQAFPFNVLY